MVETGRPTSPTSATTSKTIEGGDDDYDETVSDCDASVGTRSNYIAEKSNEGLAESNATEFVRYSLDPADWDANDNGLVEFILSKTPTLNVDDVDFSSSEHHDSAGTIRRLSRELFFRKQINGEKKLRDWMSYSAKNGSVYCFPCYFFSKSKTSSLASKDGYCNWKNASSVLSGHEQSTDHTNAIAALVARSEPTSRIDAGFIKQYLSEREYWKSVLRRVVSVVKFLSTRGLALRGTDHKLGSPHNGNYLGSMELLAEYDPFLSKHLDSYGNKGKGNTSYLSANICDEFIQLLGEKVLQFIGTNQLY